MLWFKRLSPAAILPRRGTPMSAGLDLYALEPAMLLPGRRALVRTGWAVQLPPGWYGRIAPRSSMAAKAGIDVLAGVIDADYRGELRVILLNSGNRLFRVVPGDRIAQLIIEACALLEPVEVDALLDEETERGAGGFGSTDRKAEVV